MVKVARRCNILYQASGIQEEICVARQRSDSLSCMQVEIGWQSTACCRIRQRRKCSDPARRQPPRPGQAATAEGLCSLPATGQLVCVQGTGRQAGAHRSPPQPPGDHCWWSPLISGSVSMSHILCLSGLKGVSVLAGVAIGGLGGLSGSVLVPKDGDFIFSEALRPKSSLARPGAALQHSRLHVDRFDVRPALFVCLKPDAAFRQSPEWDPSPQIKYRSDGSVGQYESDVSVSDIGSDQQLARKTVSVNNPLRFNVSCSIVPSPHILGHPSALCLCLRVSPHIKRTGALLP